MNTFHYKLHEYISCAWSKSSVIPVLSLSQTNVHRVTSISYVYTACSIHTTACKDCRAGSASTDHMGAVETNSNV